MHEKDRRAVRWADLVVGDVQNAGIDKAEQLEKPRRRGAGLRALRGRCDVGHASNPLRVRLSLSCKLELIGDYAPSIVTA